ncbi:E3 ubiquitin-protein ligase pellino homolog 1 [Hoplias malabaricus]|uniref:E3 ubiquitin-protein ligase pellino homolog 1 n=1 Tax=Hoplias malabaricus TaxID=27720 RepID=UPI003462E06B
MLSSEQESSSKPVKYGELIVLGCNGSMPCGDWDKRRKSRFCLCKRPAANGVKPSTTHTCSTQAANVIRNNIQHSVSYTLSWAETVVVEYTEDNETDMFQIGRSTESPIDIVVHETGGSFRGKGPMHLMQSTVSRFACRIVCDRSPPYTARVYAAGFDSSRHIFLGEKAAKWWTYDGQMDGLTTNGVLLMQPASGSRAAEWREISVCGNVFTLRDSTISSPNNRGKQVKDECPVLLDGSLIDLCGVTLMWRSVEGLSHSPTAAHVEALRLRLNAARPQCPVLLSTLAFPSLIGPPRRPRPWAYLTCGHVHGFHHWQGRGVAYKQHISAETEKTETTEREGERDRGQQGRDADTETERQRHGIQNGQVEAVQGETREKRVEAREEEAMNRGGEGEREREERQKAGEMERGTIKRIREGEGDRGEKDSDIEREGGGEKEGQMEGIENEVESAGQRDGAMDGKTMKRERDKGGQPEGQGEEGVEAIKGDRGRDGETVKTESERDQGRDGGEQKIEAQTRAQETETVKGDRECPLCRSRGPYVPLTLGRVPAVYVDANSPSHAFVPCGHVCSEETAKHWSKTPLKRVTNTFHPACPFCLTQLSRDRPYVKLIFQGKLD